MKIQASEFRSSGLLALGLPVISCLALSACVVENDAPIDRARYAPIETRPLDNNLVQFTAKIRGQQPQDRVIAFAECGAAQYALIRGYGFARHVRTTVYFEASHSVADAIYTISPSLPRGVKTIDAEVVVDACREQGIPTV
ncbi:MAG: hypothetical protein AAGD04_11990 [Pseudomonadota bacterium]